MKKYKYIVFYPLWLISYYLSPHNLKLAGLTVAKNS